MSRVAVVIVALVAACVSNAPRRATPAELAAVVAEQQALSVVLPGKNAAALRALLRGGVVDAGLWFADPECERRFAAPRMVREDELDAFAGCLAALHLKASERQHVAQVAVLTYDPGVEVDAWLLVGSRATQLLSIGFTADEDGATDVTVSPRALDQLRIAGEPQLNDPAVRAVLDTQLRSAPDDAALGAQLKVCIDATGVVDRVVPQAASSPQVAGAFVGLIRGWRFHPFELGGQPAAVCALELLTYPADRGVSATGFLGPPPLDLRTVGVGVGQRVHGDTQIIPPREVRGRFPRGAMLFGTFQFCTDDTGRVTRVQVYDSMGVPEYDQQIVTAIHDWRYRPAIVDGRPAGACSMVTFQYGQ